MSEIELTRWKARFAELDGTLLYWYFDHPRLRTPMEPGCGKRMSLGEAGPSSCKSVVWREAARALCSLILKTIVWYATEPKPSRQPPSLSGVLAKYLSDAIVGRRGLLFALFGGVKRKGKEPALLLESLIHHKRDKKNGFYEISFRSDTFPFGASEIEIEREDGRIWKGDDPKQLLELVARIERPLISKCRSSDSNRGGSDTEDHTSRNEGADLVKELVGIAAQAAEPHLYEPDAAIEQIKKFAGEDADLAEDLLRRFGSRLFEEGLQAARIANRAAADQARKRGDSEGYRDCMLHAMSSCRTFGKDRAFYHLARELLCVMQDGATPFFKIAQYLNEVGTLGSDGGNVDDTPLLIEIALRLSQRIPTDEHHPLGWDGVVLHACTLRRQGHQDILEKRRVDDKDRVQEAVEIAEARGNTTASGNFLMSRLAGYLAFHSASEAIAFYEREEQKFRSGGRYTQRFAPTIYHCLRAMSGDDMEDELVADLRTIKEYSFKPPVGPIAGQARAWRPDLLLGVDHPAVKELGMIETRTPFWDRERLKSLADPILATLPVGV